MEDIPGKQAVEARFSRERDSQAFGCEIIENLLGYHDVKADFFGPWNEPDKSDWAECYRGLIRIWKKGLDRSDWSCRLSPVLMREIEYTMDQYQFVFTDTVAEPVLIHGDFNLWNILIDPESFKPLAPNDTGDSCWGDR